ncbi:MAG: hypothetical protein CMG37_01785 [Candidatus Marinimicrobia bacterium]|nr:hypothetical protein [Candidatus Neomarinimicrobiota bacterium]
MLLSLQNVTLKSYNRNVETVILDSINLDIEPGESVGLVGETGSGKTMLAWTILNQLPITNHTLSGNIVFNKQELTLDTKNIKGNQISIVFQNPMQSLNPIQTIGKQFSLILMKRFQINKTDTLSLEKKWMKRVHLGDQDILSRYPHQLSGGQMQRVMIAIAMSVKPKLLIADEVTTALDANLRNDILDLIDELRDQEKTSVLLISHDLLLVKNRCKKIAVMKSGKVIECSNAEMLFKNPKQKYSRKLIDALDYKKSKDVSKKHETDILFSIKNLYKTYVSQGKDHAALKNINFDIYKNEILGIVGESASGKSTLAKILLQIVPQDKGDIMFYSTGTTPIIHEKPNRLIGAVFQDTLGSLNPRMSIFDILMEPLDLTDGLDLDTKLNKLNKCIESVGLSTDLLKRYPHMLSGGQRQRVSIARALMTDPSLLILDEPTSALDVKSQKTILKLLRSLNNDKRLTIVLISHDLRIVMETVDRLAVLYKGEIIETGNPNTIYNNPQRSYTESLIRSEQDNEK